MKTRILTIGHLKESFLEEAEKEYCKRISSYSQIEVIEVPDLKIPSKTSLKDEILIKDKEAESLLTKIKPREFLIVLDLNQKELTSEEFSSFLMDSYRRGDGTVSFAIGGSLGVGVALRKRGNAFLSFGKLTLPHQLCRIVLLEQIYRAFKIANHEPYHK